MLFIKNLHLNTNFRETCIIWNQCDDFNNSSVLLQWHKYLWRCTEMSQTFLFPWSVSMLSSSRRDLPWNEFHRTDFCHPSSQWYWTRWKRELHREYYILNTPWSTCEKKDNGPLETRLTEKRPNSSVETSMINSIEVEFKIFLFGRASVLCSAQSTRSLNWNQKIFKPSQRYQWIRTDWCSRVSQYSSET